MDKLLDINKVYVRDPGVGREGALRSAPRSALIKAVGMSHVTVSPHLKMAAGTLYLKLKSKKL